jgi:hypothetical protein
MPLDLHIIHASDFLQLNPHGHFDLQASKTALARIVEAYRKRGIGHALLDLRALHPGPKPVFTPADLATLVGAFRDMGFSKSQRLAILYHSDPHRRARLFAFLSSMHRWAVKSFGDYEAAWLWLSSDPTASDETFPGAEIKTIPIRFGARVRMRHAPKRKRAVHNPKT